MILVPFVTTTEEKLPAATQLAEIISSRPAAYIIDIPKGHSVTPSRFGFISSTGKFLGWLPGSDVVPKGWFVGGLKFSPDQKSVLVVLTKTDDYGVVEVVSTKGVVWKQKVGKLGISDFFWSRANSLYCCNVDRPLSLIYGEQDPSVPLALCKNLHPYSFRAVRTDSSLRYLVREGNSTARRSISKQLKQLNANHKVTPEQKTFSAFSAAIAELPTGFCYVDSKKILWRYKWKNGHIPLYSTSPDGIYMQLDDGKQCELRLVSNGKVLLKWKSQGFGLHWSGPHSPVYSTSKSTLEVVNIERLKIKHFKVDLPEFTLRTFSGDNKIIISTYPKDGLFLGDGVRKFYSFDCLTGKVDFITKADDSFAIVGPDGN